MEEVQPKHRKSLPNGWWHIGCRLVPHLASHDSRESLSANSSLQSSCFFSSTQCPGLSQFRRRIDLGRSRASGSSPSLVTCPAKFWGVQRLGPLPSTKPGPNICCLASKILPVSHHSSEHSAAYDSFIGLTETVPNWHFRKTRPVTSVKASLPLPEEFPTCHRQHKETPRRQLGLAILAIEERKTGRCRRRNKPNASDVSPNLSFVLHIERDVHEVPPRFPTAWAEGEVLHEMLMDFFQDSHTALYKEFTRRCGRPLPREPNVPTHARRD